MTLSDMQCRTAKPKDKPYKLSDGEGLYLEILPSGRRYWKLKYRLFGKEKRIALGAYPAVKLAEARQEKGRVKDELRNGYDPVLRKIEKKQTAAFNGDQTFERVAREWHSKGIDAWDARYAQTILHRLEKYVFHQLGAYPINMIKPIIVLACLQQVETTAPDMARRIKQLISHVCRYAIVTNRSESDPTIGLEAALRKYKKGHFASIDIDQLPDLLAAIHNHKTRLYRQTYLAIRLMLLTFVRTGELLEAKWTEIDIDKAMWTIPAERMKMRSPHLVPLSRQAVNIITELKAMNGHREYVFPSLPKPCKPMSKGTILVALRRMGYCNRMTGHGFRSLALGILKEKLNFTHEVADRQLAHVPKSSTDRAYDRSKYLLQRIEMMQHYADYLDLAYLREVKKNNPCPIPTKFNNAVN